MADIEADKAAGEGAPVAIPELVFTVAISGHQDILPARHTDLQNKIAGILATAATQLVAEKANYELDKDRKLDLRFVSALAPGADQIGANAALTSAGWKLSAILPFSVEIYGKLAGDTLKDRDAEKRKAKRTADILGKDAIKDAVDAIGKLAEDADRALELADWQPGGDVHVDRDWQSRRYATIGQMLVRQADLLIALWDGKPPRGRGGTADVVAEARRSGVPVICIDPEAPDDVRSLLPGAADTSVPAVAGDTTAVDQAVNQVMLGRDDHRAKCIDRYREEPPAQLWVARHAQGKGLVPGDTFGAYSRMLYWALRYPRERLLELTDEEKAAGKRWKPLRAFPFRLAREPGHWLLHRFYRKALLYPFWFAVDSDTPGTANAAPLLHHAARADALATRLGNQYRSAYVRIFALAPVAVMFAVLSALMLKLCPEIKHYLVMAELVTVAGAAAIYLKTRADDPVADPAKRPSPLRRIFPRSEDTHQRWLDARLIAESQRSGQLLAWVGFSGRRPIEEPDDDEDEHEHEPRFGQHVVQLRHDHSHAAARTVWAPHYANAIAALPELPGNEPSGGTHGVLTPVRIRQIAEAAGAVIADQRDYHKLNHQRLEALNHRLDTFSLRAIQIAAAISLTYLGVVFLKGAMLAAAPWAAPFIKGTYEAFKYGAAFTGAVLPALAAAAAGIRFQGDFERFAMRSKDTAARLKVLAERAAALKQRAEACGPHPCEGKPPLFEPLLDLLLDTQAVLDEDLADWRFAYAARPITFG